MNDEPTAHQPPQDIDLVLIDPSPFQRRKHYNEEALNDLASSIRKHGQTDDALVRPLPTGRFELIAGERRKRASEIAGRTVLTCKVREMSDDDARELVIIQQLQHEEWTITEEASGYADLLSIMDDGRPRFTCATLAARLDRKEGHIRELVALLDTPQEMRAAVDAKVVSKRAAATVASIPDPDQRALAAKMVLHPKDKTSPLTATETIALIQRDFVRSLGGAPFKTKDESLLPEAGSCEKCPFRTGMMDIFKSELRGSGGESGGGASGIAPNLCTKPSCYALKCAAVESKVKAEAVRRGCELMPDDEAARLFDKDGNLRDNVDYVDRAGKPDPTLCHHFDEAKMPTWKQLIQTSGQGQVKAWLAKNPVTGDFLEVILWQAAVKCVNDGCRELGDAPFFKAGEVVEKPKTDDESLLPGENIMLPAKEDDPLWDKTKEHEEEAKQKVKDDDARRLALMKRMHGALADVISFGNGDEAALKLFTEHQLQFVGSDEVINEMCLYYGLQPDTEDSLNDLLVHRDSMPSTGRLNFLIMIMVRKLAQKYGPDGECIAEWCRVLGIEEEQEQEQTAAPTDAPPSEPPPTESSESETPAWMKEAQAMVKGEPPPVAESKPKVKPVKPAKTRKKPHRRANGRIAPKPMRSEPAPSKAAKPKAAVKSKGKAKKK